MQIQKPPTTRMTEVLMECHEREILNLEPFDAAILPSANGLLTRGMVGTKMYTTGTGKKIVACYITNLGRAYLNRLSEN